MIRLDYRPAVLASLSKGRRALGEKSLEAFARAYLGHHFRLPRSRMHAELFALLSGAGATRPRRLAIAAPRGHAKSTVVSLAYVLWCLLYRKEMFVLLVSASREQATTLLRALKTELETNPLLLADFPEACVPPDRRRVVKPWKEGQIVLPNGTAVRAIGAGQRIRGLKHNQHRPTLIVADDLEEQERTMSPDTRADLRRWFEGTLLKMSEPRTIVVAVGTIVHFDSLLANLTGSHPSLGRQRVSGWESMVYRAVVSPSAHPELWERWEAIYCERLDHEGRRGPEAARVFFELNREAMLEGTEVLWEALEDYEQLMIMRLREGRAAFQAEKQNEPLDPEQCLFREDAFSYWDNRGESPESLLAGLASRPRIYGACDPSLGRRGRDGDFSAIVTVAEDPRTKRLYVLEADIARRTPEQTIARIVAFSRAYDYYEFAVEANGFQQLLVSQLKDAARAAGVRLSVREVRSTGDKKARIESLEPLVSQGRLVLSRRHTLLLEQLRQFPLGAHDDGPDALEIACSRILNGRCEVGWGVL